RWVTITDPPGIGSNSVTAMVLGINSTIGRNMPDASGKFRLTMGPLSLDQYQDLLPGGSLAERVSTITDLYMQDDLAFDVRLQLQSSEARPVQLGNEGFHLGLNTWVGRPTTPVTERVVPYRI
ncbi:MAG: type VI secretion system baseplate subunit TssG, partial [Rhodothermia bacterium]